MEGVGSALGCGGWRNEVKGIYRTAWGESGDKGGADPVCEWSTGTEHEFECSSFGGVSQCLDEGSVSCGSSFSGGGSRWSGCECSSSEKGGSVSPRWGHSPFCQRGGGGGPSGWSSGSSPDGFSNESRVGRSIDDPFDIESALAFVVGESYHSTSCGEVSWIKGGVGSWNSHGLEISGGDRSSVHCGRERGWSCID